MTSLPTALPTYTADKPPLPETREQLQARIPGWGVDLDPADRPSVPKLQFDPDLNGAHWEFPERQPEREPRERSIEHAFLTPVFGTACPPRGVSGGLRRYAYRRFSEARAAHWLLLIAADRVDALGSRLGSLLTLHPDDPVRETGVLSELSGTSRGGGRADARHHLLDPVVVVGPWVLAGGVAVLAGRALVRSRAGRR